MPHVTFQIAPGGPLLDIAVGVSQPRAEALTANNQPVPQPLPVRGLIDTGASCTCIDPAILQGLGLTPTGTVSIATPSTGNQPHYCDQYDVSITLLHPIFQYTFLIVPVIEANLSAQGIQALIGRDVLKNCLFVYDGTAGIFTLAF